MITLNQNWQDVMSLLPETGMGFHEVDVTLKGGRVHRGLFVYNCTYLKPGRILFGNEDIAEIKMSKE